MANIQMRIDDELKEQVTALYESLGLDTTTAIRMFFKASLESNGIPFEVRHKTPNAETIAAMMESEQIIHNPNTRRYTTVEELFADLDS